MKFKTLLFLLFIFIKINLFSQNFQFYVLSNNDTLAIKNGDSISISIFNEKQVKIIALDVAHIFNYKINKGGLWLYSMENKKEFAIVREYDSFFSELDKSRILNKSIHKLDLAFTIQKLQQSKFIEGIPFKLGLFIKR
jgi:lantibiotic modifying enzyme